MFFSEVLLQLILNLVGIIEYTKTKKYLFSGNRQKKSFWLIYAPSKRPEGFFDGPRKPVNSCYIVSNHTLYLSFFYTNPFLGLKILHSKVRKFTTKKASKFLSKLRISETVGGSDWKCHVVLLIVNNLHDSTLFVIDMHQHRPI